MAGSMTPEETARFINLFWSRVQIGGADDCWDWQGSINPQGYGQITYGGRTRGAHRMAFAITKGMIPVGSVIMHLCNRRSCCNPSHLHAGTPADNSLHMVMSGRGAKGQCHPHAKLTDEDVLRIRYLFRTRRYTAREIGEHFGVSKGTIQAIAHGRSWKHLGGAIE